MKYDDGTQAAFATGADQQVRPVALYLLPSSPLFPVPNDDESRPCLWPHLAVMVLKSRPKDGDDWIALSERADLVLIFPRKLGTNITYNVKEQQIVINAHPETPHPVVNKMVSVLDFADRFILTTTDADPNVCRVAWVEVEAAGRWASTKTERQDLTLRP